MKWIRLSKIALKIKAGGVHKKMNIELRNVNRDNWEVAIALRVLDNQHKFVPSVAVSLAKVYIKPDGDDVEYVPYAIYANGTMVGFIMHAYLVSTDNMYWITGFLIDAGEQGKGYGGAALLEIISQIQKEFVQCKEIRLTVHRNNTQAKQFYLNRGFVETGVWTDDEEILRLILNR